MGEAWDVGRESGGRRVRAAVALCAKVALLGCWEQGGGHRRVEVATDLRALSSERLVYGGRVLGLSEGARTAACCQVW